MVRTCPAYISDDERALAALMASIVMPYLVAMPLRVSPACTVYLVSAKAMPMAAIVEMIVRRNKSVAAVTYLLHLCHAPRSSVVPMYGLSLQERIKR
jgi:hypothetical protein